MKILFIGNSYTYFNDLPKLFEGLARENGKDVDVNSVTVGGRKLYENLDKNDEKYKEISLLIKDTVYDVLFLQEQSYLALIDYGTFMRGVEGLIEMISPKKTILYVTWGRKEGAPLLEQYDWTREQMTFDLENAYDRAAISSGAECSYVGRNFYDLMCAHKEIDLYDPDLTHPSYLGSCVAAITHYNTLFGEMPERYSSLNLEKDTLGAMISVISRQKEI